MDDTAARLRPGDRLAVRVERMVAGGEGLARAAGQVVFVPGTAPGDLVEAKVLTVQKRHARALVTRVVEPSPERVVPPCSVADRCGGCTWQHLSQEAQGQARLDLVRDALARIGGMRDERIEPVLAMADPWGYRAKAHWALGREGARVRLGWFAPRSHDLVIPDACLIQHPDVDALRAAFEEALAPLAGHLRDERKGEGWLRSAFARVATGTGECLAGVVGTTPESPDGGAWAETLIRLVPRLTTIVLNIHPDGGNKLLGRESRILAGPGHVVERIDGLEFSLAATSFFQVNPQQTAALFRVVRSLARVRHDERVLDAYCGVGALGLAVARDAGELIGIEVVPSAVVDARANAARNGIGHARFLEGTVEDLLPTLVAGGWRPDVVVVDPPRKGLEGSVIDTLVAVRPRRIVYVSCEPATLARDLSAFVAAGWQVARVQPVDMFPQTAHVETVVLLVRPAEAREPGSAS
ncbi:MAG: 23S rRNA (uracil(1939)-C(5))-methyltransferase RlmD [Candidatus Sericytochromatia bacterium]|nr:23S rRNA (uracil(1939)-C(5))-methyltransferase RlmD [Candidatus Sericytochromatia bacterium]